MSSSSEFRNCYTSPNAATTGCTRGTGFPSTDGDTPGTLLPCRKCSIHGHRCKTIRRLYAATNYKADTECEDPTALGSALVEAHDLKHVSGNSCPAIMNTGQVPCVLGVRTRLFRSNRGRLGAYDTDGRKGFCGHFSSDEHAGLSTILSRCSRHGAHLWRRRLVFFFAAGQRGRVCNPQFGKR